MFLRTFCLRRRHSLQEDDGLSWLRWRVWACAIVVVVLALPLHVLQVVGRGPVTAHEDRAVSFLSGFCW
jgi:hypothetical protein